MWVWILLGWGVLDTALCDKVCQWLATGHWFSLGTPVFSTNKTDHHDITEILLKVVLNTITLTLTSFFTRKKDDQTKHLIFIRLYAVVLIVFVCCCSDQLKARLTGICNIWFSTKSIFYDPVARHQKHYLSHLKSWKLHIGG